MKQADGNTYIREGGEDIEEAGREIGAKPITTRCIDTEGTYRGGTWGREFKRAKKYRPPGHRLDATHSTAPVESPKALRFRAGERVFTDGSKNKAGDVGAA
eukprot:679577-Prorocentrum_minimum.AAC.1